MRNLQFYVSGKRPMGRKTSRNHPPVDNFAPAVTKSDKWMALLWKRIGAMLYKKRHKLTLPEDLQLLRKTYKCSGRLINYSGILTNCSDIYSLLRNTFVTALEHFCDCSVALSNYSKILTNATEDLNVFRKTDKLLRSTF